MAFIMSVCLVNKGWKFTLNISLKTIPSRPTSTSLLLVSLLAGPVCASTYKALDLLQEHVLRFDTGSVVFWSFPDQVKPTPGNYLGDFKNELSEGDTIVEFASGGPKNYGYQTRKGKQEC